MMRGGILLVFAAAILCGQNAPGPAVQTQTQKEHKNYRLGAGDGVAISVFGLKDFDRTVTISNSGRMRVPLLGVLRVSGMTAAELQNELRRRLQERGLIKDPWVQVRITDYRAQTVYILGEVLMPGQYVLKQDMCLMDLVSLGMGANTVMSRTVYLYRPKPAPAATMGGDPGTEPPANHYEVLTIELGEVFGGEHPDMNVKLRGGDILYCPERKPGFFYVLGDLQRPGAIEMPQKGEPVLVSRAISWAGGPTRTAKMSKGVLMRYDTGGTRHQLPVDFKAVLAGKKPDIQVQANDVIYIPGSSTKTVAYGILGVIPGIAQGAVLIP